MRKFNPLPPLERLQEIFRVDEEGRIFRKKTTSSRAVIGQEVKTKNNGYIHVQLDGTFYRAHRIVWFLVYGEDPGSFLIDHINGNRADNRPSNLRLCSHGQNNLNSRAPSRNTSGIKNICFDPRMSKTKPWRARYKKKNLGIFATKEEAIDALMAAVENCDDRCFYRNDAIDQSQNTAAKSIE
jgi:hypothetical protein